jgi:GntR family transcriptional regulator/MocR family aminotransferase
MKWFALDRDSPIPLIRQIYNEISSQILDGDLSAGERIPSTREVSQELKVSRNVVLEAYDQLAAEGYLLSIAGAGTFVAEGSSLGARRPARPPQAPRPLVPSEDRQIIAFNSGRPALDLVPYKSWTKYECAARLEAPIQAFGYAPPEGSPELRETLARYLLRKRGIECRPEQIIVTSGALQGVSLLARLVLRRGAAAAIEDPCTIPVKEAFEMEGADIIPVPADGEGLRTDLLPGDASPAIVFATPSHQFPLGGCLSIQRRVALVQYAREKECLIVEDDYESEFRYDGPPVSSLQRLDPDRVAYIGTFSKIFFPALRLGYLVAPEALVEGCRAIKRSSDRYSPPASQLAMARFIEEGRLDRHIARMRKVYQNRRDTLIGALGSAFGDRVRISGGATGLHLVAAFAGVVFDAERIDALRRSGVGLSPVEEHTIRKGLHLDEVVMGYSHLSEEEIERGVARIKKTLC